MCRCLLSDGSLLSSNDDGDDDGDGDDDDDTHSLTVNTIAVLRLVWEFLGSDTNSNRKPPIDSPFCDNSHCMIIYDLCFVEFLVQCTRTSTVLYGTK